MAIKKNMLLILMTASISAAAQSWQDTSSMIQSILNRFPDSGPLGQLAISRNGQLLFSSAKGMANLEYNVPMSTESKIEAGSVSKQFTAACILLLEQQGKLTLNDNIRNYLPELPDYGQPITISHLLYHTSGIKDFLPVTYLTGWPPRTKAYSNNDYLYIIANQKTLNNSPGDEFIYSNSNYLLLAIIVERVSKTTLSEFSNQYLFGPAGMKNTEWRDDFRKVVPNRSVAYFKTNNKFISEMPN
jgi:CubicO group peptidase (beta-lactamase class C family)